MNSVGGLPRAIREHLVIRELDDETLIYDTRRDQAHCLNNAAARVWELCDGQTTAAQASRILQTELDPAIDSDFVWLAVKQLQKFHLVERGKSPFVSRRDLVFKYGPAALALLPIIYSISAPEPASAASCGVNGDPCPCCSGFSCFGSPPTCHPS
jgi:hypothetical protein